MVITLYIFFCWLLLGILVVLSRKMLYKYLAFVFLVTDFVNTHVAYLLADPIKFYKMPHVHAHYVSFSLYQSLIIPALMVIIVYSYFHYVSVRNKAIVILIALCTFASFDVTSRCLNVFIYDGGWHLAVLFGYRVLLLFLAIVGLKCFRRMCIRQNDAV